MPAPRRNSTAPPHGTVARYQHPHFPCRSCFECREAWRLYKKLYRRRRKIEFGEQAAALRKQGRFAESEVVLAMARNKS
jgi:hypothetical protein